MTEVNDILTSQQLSSPYPGNFEHLYISSRKKEDRIYTDEQVALLPHMAPDHIHSNEWKFRNRSANRLLHYLQKKNSHLSILEVGCGNGWLLGWLSKLEDADLTGIDLNGTELNQAKRVFGQNPKIHFERGELNTIRFHQKMDIILFAASIQYFPDLSETLGDALSLLNPGGEIHILDSHFYDMAQLKNAMERSRLYYQSIGYGEMAEYYFHHAFHLLRPFHYQFLYNPHQLKNKLLRRKDPFPWIRITES